MPGFIFSLLASLGMLPAPGYSLRAIDQHAFLEIVATSVTSRTGAAEVHRALARTARFGVRIAGDTVIVSGDSLELSETAAGVTRTFDPSGFLGGQWRFFLGRTGLPRLIARPFVPEEIRQTSDVAAAMDDFFPRSPPTLLPGSEQADSAGYHWSRLADSAALERYRWTVTRNLDGTRTVADSVPLRARQVARESGVMAWSPLGAPVAWTRSIHTEVTSTVRGRTVQAVVDQQIVVTSRYHSP